MPGLSEAVVPAVAAAVASAVVSNALRSRPALIATGQAAGGMDFLCPGDSGALVCALQRALKVYGEARLDAGES